MSLQAMTWVLEDSASSGNARLVLLSIANHADRVGCNASPTVATIAGEARCSRATVHRALTELALDGELAWVVNGGEGPDGRADLRPNRYWLPAMPGCPGHELEDGQTVVDREALLARHLGQAGEAEGTTSQPETPSTSQVETPIEGTTSQVETPFDGNGVSLVRHLERSKEVLTTKPLSLSSTDRYKSAAAERVDGETRTEQQQHDDEGPDPLVALGPTAQRGEPALDEADAQALELAREALRRLTELDERQYLTQGGRILNPTAWRRTALLRRWEAHADAALGLARQTPDAHPADVAAYAARAQADRCPSCQRPGPTWRHRRACVRRALAEAGVDPTALELDPDEV